MLVAPAVSASHLFPNVWVIVIFLLHLVLLVLLLLACILLCIFLVLCSILHILGIVFPILLTHSFSDGHHVYPALGLHPYSSVSPPSIGSSVVFVLVISFVLFAHAVIVSVIINSAANITYFFVFHIFSPFFVF
jgi:hypothetical protein